MSDTITPDSRARLMRVAPPATATVSFLINGLPAQAYQGDTVLTALLTQAAHLRTSEFLSLPRAGFCLMGVCQDCWVTCADGQSLRACTTLIQPGMALCLPVSAHLGANN